MNFWENCFSRKIKENYGEISKLLRSNSKNVLKKYAGNIPPTGQKKKIQRKNNKILFSIVLGQRGKVAHETIRLRKINKATKVFSNFLLELLKFLIIPYTFLHFTPNLA